VSLGEKFTVDAAPVIELEKFEVVRDGTGNEPDAVIPLIGAHDSQLILRWALRRKLSPSLVIA
jgi:hypothetical protein